MGNGGLHNPADVAADIAIHAALATGVHGAGGNTLATDADITTHAADLDAHHYNEMLDIRTGQYIYLYNFDEVGIDLVLTANRLYGRYVEIPRPMTIDRLAIEVVAAAGAGSLARLGVYAVGANMYPGALLLDAGTVLVDANAVVFVAIAGGLSFTVPGIYFFATLSDATPTFRGNRGAKTPLGNEGITYLPDTGWQVAQAFGALPDPFTAGGTGHYDIPSVLTRLSSLD